jgi:hypothetical protein
MVAMGLDVVVLMGRVQQSGRVERKLQAIALLKGLDANGNYCLDYLYRASQAEPLAGLQKAYQQMEQTQ